MIMYCSYMFFDIIFILIFVFTACVVTLFSSSLAFGQN